MMDCCSCIEAFISEGVKFVLGGCIGGIIFLALLGLVTSRKVDKNE